MPGQRHDRIMIAAVGTSARNDGNSNSRSGTTRGTGPSNTNTRDTKPGTVTHNTRPATG
jgi:hypothetical protein